MADEGEESPEFLAELDARVSALDYGARSSSLVEAREMVIHGNYLIYYRIREWKQVVEIVAFKHGAQIK